MANYLEISTGRYPVSQSQIRAENPHTSYPASFPTPEGFAIVFPAPAPSFDAVTQIAREIAPVLTAKGHYEQAYEVVSRFTEYTDDEGVVHTVAEQEAAAIQADTIAKTQAFIKQVTDATQARLDTFARTRNYDGILSACTYASSQVAKFASEGQYCVNARDNTWATLYTLMGEVEAGTRSMPGTVDEVMALLPVLEWPA